jgi:hypothetical protein
MFSHKMMDGVVSLCLAVHEQGISGRHLQRVVLSLRLLLTVLMSASKGKDWVDDHVPTDPRRMAVYLVYGYNPDHREKVCLTCEADLLSFLCLKYYYY